MWTKGAREEEGASDLEAEGVKGNQGMEGGGRRDEWMEAEEGKDWPGRGVGDEVGGSVSTPNVSLRSMMLLAVSCLHRSCTFSVGLQPSYTPGMSHTPWLHIHYTLDTLTTRGRHREELELHCQCCQVHR